MDRSGRRRRISGLRTQFRFDLVVISRAPYLMLVVPGIYTTQFNSRALSKAAGDNDGMLLPECYEAGAPGPSGELAVQPPDGHMAWTVARFHLPLDVAYWN